MKRLTWYAGILAALWLVTLSPAGAQSDTDESNGLEWSITPYLWGSSTGLDLSYRGQDLGSENISFDDLLDVLDTAAMVHVEAGRDDWSLFGDLTYLETSDTEQRPIFFVESDSTQTILDLAAVYWPDGVGSKLSVFGGLRYTDFDDRYRFSREGLPTIERHSGDSYYDVLFGARYRFDLGERWQLLTHADLSFGDSEGTWMLRANFAYLVGKQRQNRLLFGYQYKQAEFVDEELRLDYSYDGPMLGFDIRF